MPNSKQIVYLSQSQYAELIANGSITVNGVTVEYNENDIYVTPQAEPVTDVMVNGTSVNVNGIANIPMAGDNALGLVRVRSSQSFGVKIDSGGNLDVRSASSEQVKNGTASYIAITPIRQHESTFYGLAKAAGHDEASSTEPLGTYTPEAKGAIQQMLGVSDLIAPAENNLVASQAYAVGDIFTANGKLYKVTTAIAADGAIVLQNEGETVSGANAVETKVGEGFVKFTDYASQGKPGIVIANPYYGTIMINNNTLAIKEPDDERIKNADRTNLAITTSKQHQSVFYGLAKAAGDTTQSQSSNAVGQYTDTAKAAIRSMLGATSSNVIAVQDTQPTDTDTKIWLPETAETPVVVPTVAEMESALAGKVDDVRVNGASILQDGVANVPIASANSFGAVRVSGQSYGISMLTDTERNGVLRTYSASEGTIKAGVDSYQPIVSNKVNAATFYGLAKAAGDTTQSASSNAVGTYTDNAKASIKAMLGIQDGSTGTVDITGATPTITAVENTRYVCGEVTSLNFTPATSGICIVRFTSGSTVTVLTLPSTVKFPEWFDPTSLETNTIYEICVTDGIYGAVMSWAL